MSHQPSVYGRRRDTPSVIARLMGIDAMPLKATVETTDLKSPSAITSTTRSAPFNQAKCSLLSHRRDSRHCLKKMTAPRRPRSRRHRRRHPQEDLLRKIKEDFRSWQASKAPLLEFGDDRRLDGRCIQIIAQEDLRKEKTARFNKRNTATKVGGADAKSPQEKTITTVVIHCAASENLRDLQVCQDAHNQSTTEKLSSSARIVLLKPSSDHGDLPFGLSSRVKRDGNMEEFLQEVRDRLQKELKLKSASELRATEPKRVAVTETKQTAATKWLSRSEAFRSSDRKRNHATSITGAKQEHVKINTRNVLAHRPRNATPRAETVSPTGAGFDEQTCTSSESALVENGVSVGTETLPQRRLAPEPGINTLLLLLDESGSSHGASETRSSSSFSFRETVWSLRRRFSFRGRLFGRKKQPSLQDQERLAISGSPSPSESFRPACNFPQAPPSPASPVGHSSRHLFSSLPELSPNRPWEVVAPAGSELPFRTDITVETTCNLLDKAYIREVLVAAGLYDDDGSLDNKARPICDDIFDDEVGDGSLDHTMLFDLANEALQILVHGAKTGSSLGQWVTDSTGVSMSRGRKLVDDVWQQVQALRKPQTQEMQTVESMVEFEVRKSVWTEVLYEDLYVIGRKIERVIFDDLFAASFQQFQA